MEEKPGVKSSSSIVPCFLFVEVRNMNELSVIKKKNDTQHLKELKIFPGDFSNTRLRGTQHLHTKYLYPVGVK